MRLFTGSVSRHENGSGFIREASFIPYRWTDNQGIKGHDSIRNTYFYLVLTKNMSQYCDISSLISILFILSHISDTKSFRIYEFKRRYKNVWFVILTIPLESILYKYICTLILLLTFWYVLQIWFRYNIKIYTHKKTISLEGEKNNFFIVMSNNIKFNFSLMKINELVRVATAK